MTRVVLINMVVGCVWRMARRAIIVVGVASGTFLLSSRVNGQVEIGITITKGKVLVEHVNRTDVTIKVDNISFRNFNDNCETIKYVNENSYEMRGDTLCFKFDYLPKCFAGGLDLTAVRLREITIGAGKSYMQVFSIRQRHISNVKFVQLRYFVGNEEFVYLTEILVL